MTVGQYITASGIAGPTEQDTLSRLDAFITGALGWQRIDSWEDSSTDHSRVWYSQGEEPGKYAPIYFRARATGNVIEFFAYTFWDTDISAGSDVIGNSTEIRIPNSSGADEYVFFGNKDFVFASTRLDSDGANYLGGGGYWDTFYTPMQDPYPMLVFGQNASGDTFNNTARVRSYGNEPGGFLEPAATYSGGSVVYVAQDRNHLTSRAAPNPRDGRHLMLKQDFYTERARTDGDIPGMVAHEVRGEIPGLYQFYGNDFIAHERLVASGISIGDGIAGSDVGAGDWVVLRSTAANTYTIGPCVDWNQVPNTIPNVELWVKADSYHLEYGGTMAGLVDISSNTNHATQSVFSAQPHPLPSKGNFNANAVAKFDGNKYLTGSLTVVDSYTAFVVADYVPGPMRRPLLQIRGAVGSNDTLISLEFNTTVSGSAEVTVRSDGSPLEQDVERYIGLEANTAYIVSAVVSGTKTTLYVNGNQLGASTITNSKTTIAGSTEINYAIGATLDSSGTVDGAAYHSGNIAEVILYARDLTGEEHQTVVCYLGDKYGITVSGTCA